MKISNVLGVGVGIIDEEFDRLENKFSFYEKLIKSFSKDSLLHLTELKVNLAKEIRKKFKAKFKTEP